MLVLSGYVRDPRALVIRPEFTATNYPPRYCVHVRGRYDPGALATGIELAAAYRPGHPVDISRGIRNPLTRASSRRDIDQARSAVDNWVAYDT